MSAWSRHLLNQFMEAAELTAAGRKHIIRKIMWYKADFMRHVVGAPGETGAITVTPLCSTCKHIPKDDFIWWSRITTVRRRKAPNTSCLDGGAPFAVSRTLGTHRKILCNDQNLYGALKPPAGRCSNALTRRQRTCRTQTRDTRWKGCPKSQDKVWLSFAVEDLRTRQNDPVWRRHQEQGGGPKGKTVTLGGAQQQRHQRMRNRVN